MIRGRAESGGWLGELGRGRGGAGGRGCLLIDRMNFLLLIAWGAAQPQQQQQKQ